MLLGLVMPYLVETWEEIILDNPEHLDMFYVFIFQNKERIYFPISISTMA